MKTHILVWSAAAVVALLTPTFASAQTKAAKPTPPVPRTADGKPDLSGVWQPGSDRVGTWEEANQGVGVPEPGQTRARRAERPSYQSWAAAKVLESFNNRAFDNPVARCIPQL